MSNWTFLIHVCAKHILVQVLTQVWIENSFLSKQYVVWAKILFPSTCNHIWPCAIACYPAYCILWVTCKAEVIMMQSVHRKTMAAYPSNEFTATCMRAILNNWPCPLQWYQWTELSVVLQGVSPSGSHTLGYQWLGPGCQRMTPVM